MNSSEKLYQKAFEFKKTKLWEKLSTEQIFAFKLSDRGIGYINIGRSEYGYPVLRLFPGEEGIECFSLFKEALQSGSSVRQLEYQNFLQCELADKDGMDVEEQETVKMYARGLGIRLAGKYSYPRFEQYRPCCLPWLLQTAENEEALCEALEAAVGMAVFLTGTKSETQEVRDQLREEGRIVLLKKNEEGYVLDQIELPEKKTNRWPEPELKNDIAIANLKKISQKGVWECEISLLGEPVQDEAFEIPYYPFTLLAVDAASEYLIPVSVVKSYPEDAEKLMELLADSMIEHQCCPAEMKTCDDRTFSFLKGLCSRLGIKLTKEEDLSVLWDAKADLDVQMDMEEILENMEDVLDELAGMDHIPWEELPPGMMDFIELLVEAGGLPERAAEKMQRLIDLKESSEEIQESPKLSEFRQKSGQSCVISVSLGQGCYRHIQISCDSLLSDLHTAIIDAFEFDDDHAHAFFMDNKKWSRRESYYSEGMESNRQSTSRNRLCEAGIYKGKAFKYLFDFGDEWLFQCKVLRMIQGETPYPMVVRSKGKAPSQYGWDDDWE